MLLTPSDAGIKDLPNKEANEAVWKGLDRQTSAGFKWKCKTYMSFSDELRVDIEKYAAKNGNSATLKKLYFDIPNLEEGTIHLFKKSTLCVWGMCY